MGCVITVAQLLLLSGGFDSAALAFQYQPALSLTVDYGQRAASAEIEASAAIAKEIGIEHTVLKIDCRPIGAGLLLDGSGEQRTDLSSHHEWWPFRNQLLTTFAAAVAINRGLSEVILGTVASDCRHKDGTPEFLTLVDKLVQMQEGGVRIVAPAREISTVDLIQQSRIPWEVLAWTHSCDCANTPCGICPGCCKREEVLACLRSLV